MKNFLNKFITRLIKDDNGQSTTEYILILSVVVMIALKFRSSFQGKMNEMLQKVGGQLDQATNSGE